MDAILNFHTFNSGTYIMRIEAIKALFQRYFSRIAIFLAFLFAAPLSADMNLTFGVYTTDQPTEMVKAYRPVLNGIEVELSERLDTTVKISLKVSSTYEKGVSELVNGNVDFSMLGAASYIAALEQDASLRLLAIESKNDSKTFNGVIAVRADSSIHTVSQLAGKTFAFGNMESTIGRYLSQAHLVDNGVGANDLSGYDYLGRHDRVGHAVAAGKFDAGALKEGTLNKLIKRGLQLRAVTKFPNVNKAWIASSHMDNEIFLQLQSVMLSLDDEALFKPFSRKRFVVGEAVDYDVIRKTINGNSRFFEKSKTNADAVFAEEH